MSYSPDWSHFDADRACVECFLGRLKRVVRTLADDAYRTSWDTLEPSSVHCVALLNFRQRFRGHGLTGAPAGFQRTFPIPMSPGSLPAGATVRPLPRPTVHPADVRVGLTPSRALQILADRKEEEIRLLLDSFEVTFEDWEEAIRARETTVLPDPDVVPDQ